MGEKMNYNQSVKYIHSLLRFGMKPGMKRITALLDELGNPQNSLKFIHVAGTNGKGTVCTMLSEVMQQAGFKTGLFTSPYVVDFTERIQINSQMISKDDLAEVVSEIKPVVEKLAQRGIEPTEFEVITAVAMEYFKSRNCDVVVLEVGLGGLLDSTNVITSPLVSVITSVSFDHMAVLGNTLEEIAAQKCGIIKKNCPTAYYPLQDACVEKIIKTTAKEKNSRCYKADLNKLSVISQSVGGTAINYDGLKIHISLLGEHQIYNCLTALSAIDALKEQGINITDDNTVNGIKKAVLPARLEIIADNPAVILDGGHNAQGAEALSSALERYVGEKVDAVIGMMEDKECEKAISFIARHCKKIIATTPDNPRSMKAEKLRSIALRYCDDCIAVASPEKAVKLLLADKLCPKLVCGSFYLAGDVRETLIRETHNTQN